MPPRLKTPPKGRVAPAPEPKGFISGKITKAASARQGSARYSPEPSPRSRSEGRSPKAGSRPAGAQMQKAPSAADRIAARGATDQRRSARTARARAASEETSLGRLARRLARRLRRVPVVITLPEARKMTAALGLSARHLRHLRSGFDDIDVDGSGNIDPSEFFGALKEAASPLTDQLFRLMDMDGDASISFDEYVCVALAYSTYTQDDILKFCFDTFDLDGSGSIDEREFVLLARSVNNGDPLFSGNFKTALQNIDLNDDGLIDFDEFLAAPGKRSRNFERGAEEGLSPRAAERGPLRRPLHGASSGASGTSLMEFDSASREERFWDRF
ncbi:hypothetical protein M885DRAFT_288194 [Pelagophyceae sp. CCMP2097]|nr:hypothetical protein M885DRAFT_288194 [Pelagophyceae sp. CCMP2097]